MKFHLLLLTFRIKEFFRTLPRTFLFFLQRIFRGWDDSETWDFQEAFLRWALPRLKRVRKISIAYPPCYTPESWDQFQADLIRRIENLLKDFQRLGEMTLDEEEKFFAEMDDVIKTVVDNFRNFSW